MHVENGCYELSADKLLESDAKWLCDKKLDLCPGLNIFLGGTRCSLQRHLQTSSASEVNLGFVAVGLSKLCSIESNCAVRHTIRVCCNQQCCSSRERCSTVDNYLIFNRSLCCNTLRHVLEQVVLSRAVGSRRLANQIQR
jgi:hypothetical protein